MEELEEELFTMSCDFFHDYYAGFPRQTVTPFVNLGYAYIQFARKYNRIFEFVFLSRERYGRSLYDLINGDKAATAQGCRDAGGLFMKMWIFIHGAACMSLTGDYDLSEDETVQMLKDAYQSFK